MLVYVNNFAPQCIRVMRVRVGVAIELKIKGIVRFRLDVDPTGAPAGCRVLYRTNPDDFADLSCRLLMKRARFNPALDAAGKPVKSYYINNIRWVMGDW